MTAAASGPRPSDLSMLDGRSTLDVAVVGAGLAGLSAAHTLHGLRVHVIEREAIAGGRVLTVSKGSAQLDLGACFAYSPHLLPNAGAAASLRYEERDPIGISMLGRLVFAASAWGAVDLLPISASVSSALARARDGKLPVRDLPPEAAVIARALFQQIHPADMVEYAAVRQADAWQNWYPDHWRQGNRGLVDAYTALLGPSLTVHANVVRVCEHPDAVSLEIEQYGSVYEVNARAVVIATPATVARELVKPLDPACAQFLSVVRYGRYTVVAFALAAEHTAFPQPFRFIVTPEAKMGFVMQQRHELDGTRVLLCYYGAHKALSADAHNDQDLVEATKFELQQLGFAAAALDSATTWVKRWPLSGTILDSDYFDLRRSEFSRATRRIFLAGDYLSMTPGWGYGMDDAVASGRSTGALLRRALDSDL